jgi:hypothetical protein
MRIRGRAILISSIGLLLLAAATIMRTSANGYKFQIVSVVLQTEEGEQSSSFPRGHIVVVNVTLRNIMAYTYEAEPYMVVVRMTYGTTMYGFGAFKGSLLAGEEANAAPGIYIPTGAPTGSYKIKVFVWSNWPRFGGEALADPYELTFTVTP